LEEWGVLGESHGQGPGFAGTAFHPEGLGAGLRRYLIPFARDRD
jgi:hypothetical protein